MTNAERQKNYRMRHPERARQWQRDNAERNRERNNASTKKWRAKIKREVIEYYGGPACSNPSCVFHFHPDPLIACIDHKNDDGSIDRAELPGWSFYLELHRQARAKHIRDDLQILCFNCNRRKIFLGGDFSKWPEAKSELCQEWTAQQIGAA